MGAADIIRRQAQAQNEGDVEAVLGFFTKDAVWTAPQGTSEGIDAIRIQYERLQHAFPDGRVVLGRIVADGDVCMYEETFRGTNTGDLTTDMATIPATGKPFEVDSVAVVRVTGDRIAEYRVFWDQLDAMMQLGAMPG